jgi:two-component system, OmpR family, response regulator VanR
LDELSLVQLSKYSVLYAEDDPNVQKNMVEFLEQIFKEVHVAKDGLEAHKLYQKKHPDLFITDIKMPYMDGIALVKKIRETDSEIKIIMLTAYSDVELMLEVINLDLLCYTVKPITERKLFLAFEKFLKASRFHGIRKLRQ